MIGVVTGLAAEARLGRALGTARAGGGTAHGAASQAASLVADGATALISFGLAGGLNPTLPPGTLIMPGSILTASAAWPTDPHLTRLFGGPAHSLYGGTKLARTASDKKALHEATGADAIDLESGAVAEIAAAAGLPFAALRAICDPADSTLPLAAIIALDPKGAITLAAIVGSVLRHPAQLPALLRLAADAGRARAALRRQLHRIGQIRSE